jgi:hypothetical protein
MSVVENTTTYFRQKWKKIIIWLISFILAGFFLVSAAGWFLATYLMKAGKLGATPTDFYQSLNILDHIMRTSQVLVVIAASVALLLQKRIAVKLYLVNLIASVICILAIGKWGITFITPLPIIIVYAYTYWINRFGYLK